MRVSFKKIVAGAAVIGSVATAAPFIGAGVASAATNNGTAVLSPSSGSGTDPFSLTLGACPGDNNAGYTWQTFMVPASVDLNTLTFTASGPSWTTGGTNPNPASSFKVPLFDLANNPLVDQAPALNSALVNFPGASFTPLPTSGGGAPPAGAYKIGVACTNSTPSPRTMQTYWSKVITLSAGNNWVAGAAVTSAPTVSAPGSGGSSNGNGQATVAWSAVTADPAVTSYKVYVNGTYTGTPVTGTSTTLNGLTNGTTYAVSVSAVNGVGEGPQSAAVNFTPALPNAPAVQNLTAADQSGSVKLNWAAYPGAQSVPAGSTLSGFTIDVTQSGTPVGSQIVINDPSATSYTYNAPAGAYSFTVKPTFTRTDGQTQGANGATVGGNALAGQLVQQVITASRPNGALVLTQVCGRYGDLPAENPGLGVGQAGVGFPATIPAATAVDNGVAPTRTPGDAALSDPLNIPTGQPADNQFSGYPYPDDANGLATPNYPTVCNVAMPAARLVDTGAENLGKGKFFATTARLNQVTVVDTRDTDPGWNIGASVTDFLAPGGKSFSGNQLGWTPVKTDDTQSFQDALNNTYDQQAFAGSPVLQNTKVLTGGASNLGLSGPAKTLIYANGRTPGTADQDPSTPGNQNGQLSGSNGSYTGGLGIAVADARLKLAIPVTAMSGNYTAILTISVI